MSRVLVLLAVLAGCNQVFGLEQTEPANTTDSDGDGVTNAVDNCPLVSNVGQADADGDDLGDACDPCPDGPESNVDADHDGVDDACDPCPSGPQHDEDGDLLFDACDNCPAQANPGQENTDGDDLGDACDRDNNTAQQRVLFDGFSTIEEHWERHQLWGVDGDGIIAIPDLDSHPTLADQMIRLGPQGWSLELGATLPPGGGTFGVGIDFSGLYACSLTGGQPQWFLFSANVPNMPVTPANPVVLRYYSTGQATAQHFACELASPLTTLVFPTSGTTTTPANAFPLIDEPQLGTRFEYLDLVRDAL